MRLNLVLLISIPVAGVLGYTQATANAAGVPSGCNKYECKTIHAYWADYQPSNVYAFHKVNLTDNYDSLQPQIFTQICHEKDAMNRNGNYDGWVWSSCSPQCGKSVPVGGTIATWQSPQEVAHGGTGWSPPGLKNQIRYTCSAADGGNGVLAADQDNPNTEGKSPPGN